MSSTGTFSLFSPEMEKVAQWEKSFTKRENEFQSKSRVTVKADFRGDFQVKEPFSEIERSNRVTQMFSEIELNEEVLNNFKYSSDSK